MSITFHAIPTETARAYQAGQPDAYGLPPERAVSDGNGVPCRHCLKLVPMGRDYLILAHRPFPDLQPYAETGPIFLCADPCEQGGNTAQMPEILESPAYILRGYSADNRILYGTGAVTLTKEIPQASAALLARPDMAYVHVRSASNTCFQLRIDRG